MIPGTLGRSGCLPNIRRVILINNKIAIIDPRFFDNLENLEDLDLKFNNLSDVPPAIEHLTKLNRLGLTGNLISTIPCFLSKMHSLETVLHEWPALIKPEIVPPEASIKDLTLDEMDFALWNRIKFDWQVVKDAMRELLKSGKQRMTFPMYLHTVGISSLNRHELNEL